MRAARLQTSEIDKSTVLGSQRAKAFKFRRDRSLPSFPLSIDLGGELVGMEGLPGKEEATLECESPTGLNELGVVGIVGAVELVADDGESSVVEVDTDLVHTAGKRARFDE